MRRITTFISHNEFLKGSFILTAFTFLGGFLNYLFNVMVARALGPSGFGEIAALFSYVSIASVPFVIISKLVIQKISSVEKDRYHFVFSLEKFFWEKLKRWYFLFILALPVVFFLPYLTNLSSITAYSLPFLLVLTFFSSFFASALQGLRLFFAFAIIDSGSLIIKLLGAVLVMVGIGDIATIILFLFASMITASFVNYMTVQKKLKKRISRETAPFEARLIHLLKNKQFLFAATSILAITFLNNIDVAFAKKFFSPYEAGIYSSWSLTAKVMWYICTPLISVSFIYFSEQKNSVFQKNVGLISAVILAVVGIVSFFGYRLFNKEIIMVLFGSRFLGVAPFLGYASIFGFFYTCTHFINSYFMAKKSVFSLALPMSILFYILFLFLFARSLIFIMKLNVFFTAALFSLHLVLLLRNVKTHLLQ